jgi:NADH-quinone oxidoreductase subunit F
MASAAPADLSALDPILEHYRDGGRAQLLPVLHDAHDIYGYVSEAIATRIGQAMRIPLADIYGVLDFYTLFYRQPVGERIVRVCTDPSCAIMGGEDVLQVACKRAGVEPGGTSQDGAVTVERMQCIGLCDQAPAALVDKTPIVHVGTAKKDIDALLRGDGPPSKLLVSGEPRVLTANIGVVDPSSLDDYVSCGGFEALRKALEVGPEAVIEAVKDSGIVGRGGAAFPTGLKWQFTRGAVGEPKYVICNADESEPGTFKDRVLMEGDPFRVLEGMALAGLAIGSEKGYVFLRGEYPLAREAMQTAIDAASEAGYLGQDILGFGFNFEIEIRVGAGAYICGEETALFEAIEGKRGFPRVKPPFPTTHGLFGKPTAVNNVETLAASVDIVRHGSEWFRQWGTEQSAGTKLFCVSGHVARPGLVEVPFGTTVRALLDEHCGGVTGELQAILMGGAAGGFLLPEQLDTPLTFEALSAINAPVGSGVIAVFDSSVDVRDVLARLAHFFAHESCGKCFPCQIGTQRQAEVLDRATAGQSHPGDAERLTDVGWTMTDASLCGLGQTAASAVLSALDHWPDLVDGRK